MTNRPVHLVLDTSAIAAFGRTVHVGEPIGEIRDNDAAVALPVPCLVEASRHFDEEAVRMLIADPVCELIGVDVDQWEQLAATRRLLKRFDLTAAFVTAEVFDCHVLTAEPERYAALGDDPPIIPI